MNMKNAFHHMLDIIAVLEANNVYYKLNKVNTENDSILIEAAIPGERWEIEIDSESNVYIERFISNGTIYSESELHDMLKNMEE